MTRSPTLIFLLVAFLALGGHLFASSPARAGYIVNGVSNDGIGWCGNDLDSVPTGSWSGSNNFYDGVNPLNSGTTADGGINPVVNARVCSSDNSSPDTGFFARTKRCDEGSFDNVLAPGMNATTTCVSSASQAGRGSWYDWRLQDPSDTSAFLDRITIVRGFRSSTKRDSDGSTMLSRYQWGPQMYTASSSGVGGFGIVYPSGERCVQTADSPGGVNASECINGADLAASTRTMNRTELTGNPNSTPYAVGFELRCGGWLLFGSYCGNWKGNYVRYAARFNMRGMTAWVWDSAAPGFSGLNTSWNQNCHYQPNGASDCGNVGSFTYSGDVSDNTGLKQWTTLVNSAAQFSGSWGCTRRADTLYIHSRACPSPRSMSTAFSPTTEGAHTVQLQATDMGGNTTTTGAATLHIDTSGGGCPAASHCADREPNDTLHSCPAGFEDRFHMRKPTTLATGGPGGTQAWSIFSGQRWIKGSVWLRGCGNDKNSGATQFEIQWQRNGGAWNTACRTTRPAPSGGGLTAECAFDTTTSAQGDEIRFRGWMVNGAGIISTQPVDGVYKVDNTAAPTTTLSVSGLSPASSAVTVSTHRGGTGWTNAESLEAWWDQDNNSANGRQPWNDGPGSGIDRIEYRYTPDLDGGGAGNCPTTAVLSVSATSTATSPLRADRRDQCRQGQHRVEVRTVDNMNNVGPWVNTTFNYDSYPTPETRDLAWPCQGKTPSRNCFRPRSFLVNPIGWSATNSFTLSWTNPTYNGTTEAPLVSAKIRAEVAGAGLSGSGDIRTYGGCVGSGATCSLPGLQISPDVGGSYPVRIWLRDAAGNAEEEESASGTINYSSNQCTRRN